MKKKIISLVLCLAMLVGTITVVPGAMTAKATDETTETQKKTYTELTFADFGLADGEYTSTSEFSSVYSTARVTSLDGVAVSGKVTFKQSGNEFRIGLTSRDGFVSIACLKCWKLGNGKYKIYSYDYFTGGADEILFVNNGELGQEIDVRFTFDYVSGNDVEVNYYVDGKWFATHTASGVANELQPQMRIVSTDKLDLNIKSVWNDYEELTFADFGLEDKEYTDMGLYSISNADSLYKAAIIGKLQFTTEVTQLRIGTMDNQDYVSIAGLKCSNVNGKKVLKAWDIYSDKDYIVMSEWDMNRVVDVRITFDYVDDSKVQVVYYIDGKYAISYTTKDLDGHKVQPKIRIHNDVTDKKCGVKFQSACRDYKTLTFSDWGVPTDKNTQGTQYALKDSAITSLDGYAVEGVVNFQKGNIRFGGRDNAYVGVQIWIDGNNLKIHNHIRAQVGDTSCTPSEWNKDSDNAYRFAFSKWDTDMWLLRVWVNGKQIKCEGLPNTNLGTKFVYEGANLTLGNVDRGDLELEVSTGAYQVAYADTKIDGVAYGSGSSFSEVGEHSLTYTLHGMAIERTLVCYKAGDANADGDVDVKDIVRLKKFVQQTETADRVQTLSADFDKNSLFTDEDATAMRQLLAGQEETLSVSLAGPSYTLFPRHGVVCG